MKKDTKLWLTLGLVFGVAVSTQCLGQEKDTDKKQRKEIKAKEDWNKFLDAHEKAHMVQNKKNKKQVRAQKILRAAIIGGVAYYIGYFIWNEIYPFLMEVYPKFISKINDFNNQFAELGILLIVIGGFSPFPYKITCVGSGIIGINIFLFTIFSILSRLFKII